MGGQHQNTGPVGFAQPHRREQSAGLGVETRQRAKSLLGHRGDQFTADPNLAENVRFRLCDKGHRIPVEPAPQHLVSVDDRGQHGIQAFAGDPVGQPDDLGLCQPARVAVLVEPMSVG
ncbi:Uncharacterised protein [Mycobacterium tuberculosis]|nr:Uncharacterised protein [Mycobacterium tuberculosis]CKS85699.1 Uncharacterised protein [Mycobacterium tuberculosis]CKT99414.1 Uncharacterised protein [Mycobacterium tuberculosis]CKU19267.1 Uncharacterised protein [Mycobacterium tuberculosis]CKU24891.1 Uncharacterised protein [Mycobacterium tuberculosis]